MDTDLADFAVTFARKNGCEYAEARMEHAESDAYLLKNGIPQISGFDETTGMGVRFLHQGALGFFSSNALTRTHLREGILNAIRKTKAALPLASKVSFAEEKAYQKTYRVRQRRPFADVSPEDKLAELTSIDKALKQSKANVISSFFELSDTIHSKYLVTSDGARIRSEIPRVSFFYMMTIQEGGRSNQRYWENANVGGFEAVKRWNLAETLQSEAEALRKNLLDGRKAPSQKLDVVVGPQIAGIMAHEASGHPMEADRILGREAAQAGESFITQDMQGTRIGSDAVSVVDDPTLENTYGYFLYDDEGVKARKKYLYKKGIIDEFLHNKETAALMGVKSNGSSRASAYDREPLLRMSNTFIEPGTYAKDELFEDIKLGVYMKNFTEWNIDDRRFQQKYVGAECYLIKDGRLTDQAVFGPALEITTPQLYGSIDACGKDLEYHPGNCGKGEPMQGIPVTLGGPSVRIRNLRLN
ncbi:MAG: TldD/PmbA family protein [DPANN group archaeon]|nr:TldD/PmbA family protein [DPANN group archaeon]